MTPEPGPTRSGLRALARLAPWLVAAGAACAAGGLLVRNTMLRRDNEDLRTERDLANTAHQMARNQVTERTLIAERLINDLGRQLRRRGDLARLQVAALDPMQPAYRDVRAIVVWDPELPAGLLTVEGLPPAPAGEHYRLWLTAAGRAAPVRSSLFAAGPDGRTVVAFAPEEPISTVASFAVFRDQGESGARPDGPVVLSGR